MIAQFPETLVPTVAEQCIVTAKVWGTHHPMTSWGYERWHYLAIMPSGARLTIDFCEDYLEVYLVGHGAILQYSMQFGCFIYTPGAHWGEIHPHLLIAITLPVFNHPEGYDE